MDKNVVYYMDYCASESNAEADLGEVCRGCTPSSKMTWLSYTTGILQKKKKWFIGVEVHQTRLNN